MELTQEQLQKLIELSGIELHYDNIDSQQISKILIMIERKLNFFAAPIALKSADNINVLIVDDLELSIFQFLNVLQKIGVNPSVARSKEEAIAEIKKKKFDFLVLDLYLPDLTDGHALIKEAIKFKENIDNKYKIIVMSSTDNEDIIQECYKLGIDKFVPKTDNWHEAILKFMAENIAGLGQENINFSKFFLSDDILVYSLNRINSKQYISELIKDVNLYIAAGHKNIILNFEKIRFFDIENASFFSEIYKAIKSQGGEMVIVKPADSVKQVLEDIYLADIIKTAQSIDEAVSLIGC